MCLEGPAFRPLFVEWLGPRSSASGPRGVPRTPVSGPHSQRSVHVEKRRIGGASRPPLRASHGLRLLRANLIILHLPGAPHTRPELECAWKSATDRLF